MNVAGLMDVNCDMGESFGNWRMGDDAALLTSITTANVACGFHGGDPVTMIDTVEQALALGVVVGAHPGLPDLLGFGRRVMDISPHDAYAYILYQGGALTASLRARGAALHHVKPHGALYTMLNDRADLAAAVADAMAVLMEQPMLYWPAGAEDGALVQEAKRREFHVVLEFYPDLSYTGDGRIVVERHKKPVEAGEAVDRLARFLDDGSALTVDGSAITLAATSVCVHGDGPTAPAIAAAVRTHLESNGWRLAPAAPDHEEGGVR